MLFSELPSHRIVESSKQVPCNTLMTIFITDKDDNLHAIFPNGTIKKHVAFKDNTNALNFIHDTRGFTETIMKERNNLLTPLSMLKIVSEVSKPLQEIADIHRLGRGSLKNGFLAIIGGIIETGFKAAGYLFTTNRHQEELPK